MRRRGQARVLGSAVGRRVYPRSTSADRRGWMLAVSRAPPAPRPVKGEVFRLHRRRIMRGSSSRLAETVEAGDVCASPAHPSSSSFQSRGGRKVERQSKCSAPPWGYVPGGAQRSERNRKAHGVEHRKVTVKTRWRGGCKKPVRFEHACPEGLGGLAPGLPQEVARIVECASAMPEKEKRALTASCWPSSQTRPLPPLRSAHQGAKPTFTRFTFSAPRARRGFKRAKRRQRWNADLRGAGCGFDIGSDVKASMKTSIDGKSPRGRDART